MVTIVESFAKQIESFMLLLTQKEKFVIERRFNLDKKEKATLEEIGQHFSVTRERIRQIEKNAINKLKRNLENCNLFEIANIAFNEITAAGGVIREDLLTAKLIIQKPEYSIEALQLILSIDKRFNRVPNTVAFHPYLKLSNLLQSELEGYCRLSVEFLNKYRNTIQLEALYNSVITSKKNEIDQSTFRSLIQIDKKIKLLEQDLVGLFEWRHINPRTLRDKIYFVLRQNHEPMHFMDIANKIIESNFDKKKINLQAVHNELIRHDEFVLIGRGIYGLSEWGYKSGTVAEVITSILKGKESMSQQEIIGEVLKQRKVKPITVILSLKNKDQFIRVGRKQYGLKAA
jgi:hypothetical protein